MDKLRQQIEELRKLAEALENLEKKRLEYEALVFSPNVVSVPPDVQNALKLLGLSADGISSEKAKDAYRRLAKRHHPDAGGNGKTMTKLNSAYKIVNDWLSR